MKEILKVLEQDARATPQQIATMTGLPVAEVEKTLEQALAQGIILKYKALINWEKAGEERVWALIEVKVAPQRDVGFDAVAERIARFPQVHTMYLVSGTYDLAVLVVARTMHEVAAFVSEKLAPLESVQSTVTHFLLKRYKEDGELLAGEERVKRLPLAP